MQILRNWLAQIAPRVLNVAGPRASEDDRIYDKTRLILETLLMNSSACANGCSNQTDLITIALARRESALTNFRHWDQIRWLVPYWFCILSTAGGGIVSVLARPENAPDIQRASFGLGIFGVLCLLLIWNLGRYHNRELANYHTLLDRLTLDSNVKKVLQANLPFSFTLNAGAIFKTATCWFFLYIVFLTGLFFFTAWRGLWWQAG